MAAKDNLTKAANITVSVREIDFVSRFGRNWDALRAIMGIMRPIEKTPGTKLVSSVASVTLQSGTVAEGDEIPLSLASVTPVAFADLAIEKYAKGVSVEAVAKYGAAIAVQKTDDAFLNQLQQNVLTKFYNFIATGQLTYVAPNFQSALAYAKGNVIDKFQKMRKTATEVVGFANILDFTAYLAGATISTQTQYGLTYVENFLGYRVLFLLSAPDVPVGKVYATAVENIDLYYIDPSNSDFAQLGLEYTVQGETNLIGFHAEGDYTRATGTTFALMGMALWAEYIDAISVVTIDGTTQAATSCTFTSGAATNTDGATKITVTSPASTAVTPDLHFFVKAQASSAPSAPAYLAIPDDTWTEIKLNASNIADNVTGFTSGHKMRMVITNGTGQVIYDSGSSGVSVVVKA